jgi:putative membrane-bound dehydrogenase-like protein
MSSLQRCPFSVFVLLAGCLTSPAAEGKRQVQHGLRVPAGFEVSEFADSSLANDIYTMTLDSKGRVVVAGRGYIRILEDKNGDGRADSAIEFAPVPKSGAMGLLWEGNTLYCTGDAGLLRFRDADGDGKADGPPETILPLKTGSEHSAHAVRRGPDGWLYILGGNNTGIDGRYVRGPGSPIKEPVAGCVLRLSPDLKTCEVVADGFRNAYGMDFSARGELFTYDSDNERCVSLPWYESTRFYHVLPGGHHGWLNPQRASWWRLPPYFLDVTAPVATLGRGSPTGVVCYRHGQFPERYRGGFFLLDWTFGRIYFVAPKRTGATYTATPEVFLEAAGDNGFAPTGAVVHPGTGDLYVCIGGRGTRGAVYRIRYPAGLKNAGKERPLPRRSLDWNPGLQVYLPLRAQSTDALQRVHALAGLRRHREHFQPETLEKAIKANAGHGDRYVRQAVARLIADLPADQARTLSKTARISLETTTFDLGRVGKEDEEILTRCLPLAAGKRSMAIRLAAVRLVQLALGGLVARASEGMVWEGYSPRRPVDRKMADRIARALRPAFPSGNTDLDRELSRTLAVVEDESSKTLEKVAARLTAASDPVEDIHYLIVLSRLKAPRTRAITHRVASALLLLDEKAERKKLNRERHWFLRLGELHQELARKDSALNAALLARPEFGRPDHVLWTEAPGLDRPKAAALFLARAGKEKDYPWDADLVKLIAELPAKQCLPVLRKLWDRAGLNDAILPVLARTPQAEDRGKFLKGLGSTQTSTVRLCLAAIEKLPERKDPETVLALVQALRRFPDGKEEAKTREALARYLQRLTGEKGPGLDRAAWVAWFGKTYPALAEKVRDADGVDVVRWTKRLATLEWSRGDVERGRLVYQKATCAACHSGAQALGPDLRGVTGRFSRADLFTAILQPSKDVSSRYRTTMVITGDDRVYQGVIVYEAVDSLILQTGPATTVRLAHRQIVEKNPSPLSLMPTGLLEPLSDREIVDLYLYLKSLGPGEKPSGSSNKGNRK